MFISFFFTSIRDAVPRHARSWLVRLMLLMTLMIAVSGATAAATPASLDKTRQVQLEAQLTGELQRVVNAQRRIEGQGRDVAVSVRFVRDDRQQLGLVIDLSEAYVPQGALYFGAEMEDLTGELANIASEFLRNIIVISGVDIRFGGKDIYDYFPAESRFAPFSGRGASAPATAATIVSAAGHGIYYHYGFKDWRAQRDPSNGITEDFITPDYATELSLWLEKRSDIAAKFPRSNTTAEHGPSGQPWDEIGARYNLQQIYPENPNIWHSLPDATGNLRERNEDIRSRPLFANHIGADAIFHLSASRLA